tara:strand:+ start:428 stop:1063 length:636 start_codon:yes stop_codon:yes gene_type:complete
MAAEIDHQAAAARRTRFWIAPLVAGCCFSLGYGVTHRLMAMQSSVREIKPEGFDPQRFPGSSLSNLRSRSGDRSPLQVDLAAIDVREALEKTPQLQAKPLSQGNGTPALALQTSPVAPLAALKPTQPGFDDPIPAVELTPAVGLDPIETAESEPVGAGAEPPFPNPLVLVETPLSETVASPSLDTAAPFEPELTDKFFLPVLPQAPLPPTP